MEKEEKHLRVRAMSHFKPMYLLKEKKNIPWKEE
jgi:hypothetical protein